MPLVVHFQNKKKANALYQAVVCNALGQMKKNYPAMNILDETDKYVIGHIHEDAYLIDKRNGQEILHDDFYGDPTCGLISKSDKWAIIAGEHITIWKNGKTTRIDQEEVKWVHSIRASDDSVIEILIDPWIENSAIWTMDLNNFELNKVKDFDDYKEKERTDNVVW